MHRLFLIDTFSLLFQVFHAIPPMTGPKGEPTNAVFGFTRDLKQILANNKPSHVVVCMESEGDGARSETYADYKANRDEMPADLRTQIPLALEVAAAYGLPVISHPGWEADDVFATLATRAAASDEFDEVAIVTSDKDARQLLGPKVRLFNCRTHQYYDTDKLAGDWGVTPDRVTDFQGLVGDSTDNIPGVPKVGPKAAAALLEQFGTLDAVLEAAAADKIEKSRVLTKPVRENLKTHAESARVSRKLATLETDLPIDLDWADAEAGHADAGTLREIFERLGFKRFAEEAREGGDVPGTPDASPPPETTDGEIDWEVVDSPAAFDEFVKELKKQDKVCVDLETTDTAPAAADIVGWAVCWSAGTAYYLPVDGPPGSSVLDGDEVLKVLGGVLSSPDVTVTNQNLKYDAVVLARHGVEVANYGVDPMVGDYLLSAGERSHGLDALALRHLDRTLIKIDSLIGKGKQQKKMFEVEVDAAAEYAAEDAAVAWKLADVIEAKLRDEDLWDLYWDLERPLIPVLVGMETKGIRVDVPELEKQSEKLTARLEELEHEAHRLAGKPFNLGSPKQLREIFFDEMGLPVLKRTKTGPSTDAEVLERLANDASIDAEKRALPQAIAEHRVLAKLKGTYLDALPKLVNERTGNIHTSFSQVVAATGRLSSSEPNLQNIPIRTEEGRQIRKAFVPSEDGWTLLCADYSQIELRVLAHFCGDAALVEAFKEGRDIHRAVAADVFGVDEADVTADQRAIAKTVNFGVIYGQTAYGLSTTLGIPQDEAGAFIDQYKATFSGVTGFIAETLEEVRRTGVAKTILGRRRQIDGIRPNPHGSMTMPERTAFNTVIQGSAADLIKRAMIAVDRRLRDEDHPARLLLQIHDELVFEVPEELADDLATSVREDMSGALELSVPVVVDVGTGATWFDAK